MDVPSRTSSQLALLAESQNIMQADQAAGASRETRRACLKTVATEPSATSPAPRTPAATGTGAVAGAEPSAESVAHAATIAKTPSELSAPPTPSAGERRGERGRGHTGGSTDQPLSAESAGGDRERTADEETSASAHEDIQADAAAAAAAEDCCDEAEPDAASIALARRLLEQEALSSYAAAVDMFCVAADGADGSGGMEGVSPEDMAAIQAFLREDESNAAEDLAGTENDSLDYDDMLELGSAIGDVRKERWRTRCKEVIANLPKTLYNADNSSEDMSKCLVCQCEYEHGDELRRLPCKHAFHAACVDGWLEENEECPTCRRSIAET